MSYFDDYNLLNSRLHEKNGENALLYTVELFLINEDVEVEKNIQEAIEECRLSPGIYAQHPCKNLRPEDEFMSHDQLTAIFSYSKYRNELYHVEIWEEIKRQLLKYNNVDVPTTFKQKWDNKRYLHPRDIIYYGYCAGSVWCKLLIPVLFLIMLITALRDKSRTSGKLLNFVRLMTFKSKSLLWNVNYKLHELIIRKQYGGWKGLFLFYFKDSKHPTVEAWEHK